MDYQPDKEYLILNKYVNKIEQQYGVNINLHDVIGITAVNSAISIVASSHSYHNNGFCNFVKKDKKGLRACVINKDKLCRKCEANCKPFYGKCYMGAEELVYPIVLREKLVAILCVGQFYTNEEKSTEILKQNAQKYTLSEKELSEAFFTTVKKADEETLSEINIYIKLLADHLTLLLEESLRNTLKIDSSKDAAETFNSYKNNFIISSTVDFINKNYEKQISLETLALNSYCNPTYLSYLFKEKMKIGVSEYINYIRVQAAKELLDITVKPITEIALMVGFNDGTYFSRVFKGIESITPKEYRLKINT